MARRLRLMFLVCICLLIGWLIGYFQIPYIQEKPEFMFGFLLCLSLLGLIYALRKLNLLKASVSVSPSNKIAFVFLTLSALLLLLSFATVGWNHQQTQLLSLNLDNETKRLEELNDNASFEVIKSTNEQIAMILEIIQNELSMDSADGISESTIDRLGAISKLLKPRKIFDRNSDSLKILSPERGLLLLNLVHMDIDSSSLMKIKQKVTFEAAGLESADLSSLDLSCINLSRADLSHCQLIESNFHHANLEGANFEKSDLTKSCFNGANLTRANMKWVNASSADFVGAVLDGAFLKDFRAVASNLNYSSIKWANMYNAQFDHTQCTKVDFKGSDLSRTNFEGANLKGANMVRVILKEAHLGNSELDQVRVKDNDWFISGYKNNVSGISDIEDHYNLVADSGSTSKFLLKLKD
jgi:uncharacterized protein YjbI with pentapeptide repeats